MEAVFAAIEMWLAGLGGWAYLVAPLVMATVSFFPLPAEAPALANGMLFGPVAGSAVTWVGAMLGAWASYEVARAWGRPVAHRIADGSVVQRVGSTIDAGGWWGLLVLRFIPVVAFTAINWGAGLLTVPRWRFLWTTGLGIVPGVVLFTSSGAGLGALYRRSPGWAAALAIVVVVTGVLWVRRLRAPGEVGADGPGG